MRYGLLLLVFFTACGGKNVPPAAPKPAAPVAPAPAKPEPPKPLAYEAGASPGEVVSACVRPERSSRLALPLPKGKPHEAWTAELDAKLEPAFVLASGTRVVVVGKKGLYAIFDTKGMSIASGTLGVDRGDRLHIDPANGVLAAGEKQVKLADGSDAEALPEGRGGTADESQPLLHAASHGDATIHANGNALEVKDSSGVHQVIQGAFEIVGIAVDDQGVAFAMVKQGKKGELSLWITPIGGGSIGRVKIPNGKTAAPPILGKIVRVIQYEDRLVGIAAEGKQLWEKKKPLTGGASMTADDRLLVATDDAIRDLDPANGKGSDLVNAKGETFTTPPILAPGNILLAASNAKLHAYAFDQ